jgi:hypothetical protein
MWICFCCNDQRYLKRKISKWSANSKNKAVLKFLDFGYVGEISKSPNFSGWQKKYTKSENYR